MSGIRLPDGCKLTINQKKDNDVTICELFFLFDVAVSTLSSYWSKFHVNIMTGSGVMVFFIYKGLSRNPESGNTPV